jgi:hypothetical protein
MKQLVLITLVAALLSACGGTVVRTPAANPQESSAHILIKAISVHSEQSVVDQGYTVFLRVTGESEGSGIGSITRYPEDGVLISLEPGQQYPLSPQVQIPYANGVIVELSVFALPQATTMEALQLLERALPRLGRMFVAQNPIAPLIGTALGTVAGSTRRALEDGRMVAYHRTTAAELAQNCTVRTAEMEFRCEVVFDDGVAAQAPVPPQAAVTTAGEQPFFMARAVTAEDLAGKTAFELDVMRNEIFARHGRAFNRADLQRHFDAQPWYQARFSPDTFDPAVLTAVQRRNVQFILDYQVANGLRTP